MKKVEYTVLGLNMESISVIYGIFLISWGIIISVISNSASVTSFIPTIIGIPILILSLFAIWFSARKKMLMHFSVIFGLLAFIGGFDFFRDLLSYEGIFLNFYALTSKLMLLLTGGVYCFLCIQSFRFARKTSA